MLPAQMLPITRVRRLLKVARYLLTMAAISFCVPSSEFGAPAVKMAGRNITFGLIQIKDRAPAPPPEEAIILGTKSVVLRRDESIPDILIESGIFPDLGAYAILYDLNPGVTRLDKVADKTGLTIPTLALGPEWKRALADRTQLVKLSVDVELYEQLQRNVAMFSERDPKFQAVESRRFAEPGKTMEIKKEVSDVIGWCRSISAAINRGNAPPTSRDTVLEMVYETAAMADLIRRATTTSSPVTKDDERQIGAIHRDIEDEIQRYNDVYSGSIPPGEDAADCVLIATIEGGSDAFKKKLRVYWAFDGEFHRPPPPSPPSIPFKDLGSSKSDPVKAKRYQVWAAPDGHPEQIVTEEHFIVIAPGQKQSEFQLSLKARAERR